jgi:hypothetical protein
MSGDRHQLAHRLEGYRSASVRNSVPLKSLTSEQIDGLLTYVRELGK